MMNYVINPIVILFRIGLKSTMDVRFKCSVHKEVSISLITIKALFAVNNDNHQYD